MGRCETSTFVVELVLLEGQPRERKDMEQHDLNEKPIETLEIPAGLTV